MENKDILYMKRAIELAEMARELDEVPVGALIVHKGEIISEAYNTRESSKCATHHAEILAIEGACKRLGGWRLPECTLYVTMEPCVMCAGAIYWAKIPRVVYGASEEKYGFTVKSPTALLEKTEVVSGVLADECAALMKEFFKSKRK